MRRAIFLVVFFVLISFIRFHATASELSIGIDQAFLELEKDANGKSFYEVEYRLIGGTKSRIHVELTDLIVNNDGLKELLPLGATPESPLGLFKIEPYDNLYEPNGRIQKHRVKISSVSSKPVNRSVVGGLRITVDPSPFNKGNGTYRAIGVALTFAYSPEKPTELVANGRIENFELGITNPKVTSMHRLWLPELPSIKSSGPITFTYSQKNFGNIYQIVSDSVMVRRLGGSAEDWIHRTELENRLLLPNQVIQKEVSIVEKTVNSNREINPLGWGVYQLRVVSKGRYLDNKTATQISEKIFIIFPWKQSILLIFVILILLRRNLMKRNWPLATTEDEPPVSPTISEVQLVVTKKVKKSPPRKKSAKRIAKKTPSKRPVKKAVKKNTRNLR